jgi:hypothetical protein
MYEGLDLGSDHLNYCSEIRIESQLGAHGPAVQQEKYVQVMTKKDMPSTYSVSLSKKRKRGLIQFQTVGMRYAIHLDILERGGLPGPKMEAQNSKTDCLTVLRK